MIVWAFNLLILAVGILIVGLIKPKWLLFWMDNPNRYIIVGISTILLMAGAIMFGEGNRQNAPLSEVGKAANPSAVAEPVVAESPADLVK